MPEVQVNAESFNSMQGQPATSGTTNKTTSGASTANPDSSTLANISKADTPDAMSADFIYKRDIDRMLGMDFYEKPSPIYFDSTKVWQELNQPTPDKSATNAGVPTVTPENVETIVVNTTGTTLLSGSGNTSSGNTNTGGNKSGGFNFTGGGGGINFTGP